MALEIENDLVAALSGGGDPPVIGAQFGILNLVHVDVGEWTVTTVESLGPAEFATTCVPQSNDPYFLNVRQLAPNQWAVSQADQLGDPADGDFWHLKIYRIATGA